MEESGRGGAVLMLCGVVVSLAGFFFQAEDGIRDSSVTGVQTCALPIRSSAKRQRRKDLIGSSAGTGIWRLWLRLHRFRAGTSGSVRRRNSPIVGNAIAQMRADQIGNILGAVLERLYEKLSGCKLIFVRRILQQFRAFLSGGLVLLRRPAEAEMAERVFLIEEHAVKARILRIHSVSEHHLTQFT